MIRRLAYAHGLLHACVGIALALILQPWIAGHYLGLTYEPMSLGWLLGVYLVTVALLPLRDALGMERSAVRGEVSAAARAGAALVLLGAAPAVYLSQDDAASVQLLIVFMLIIATVGFLAAAWGRTEPWAWSLGVGLVGLGLEFFTRLAAITQLLSGVPFWAATTAVLLSAGLFVGCAGRPRTMWQWRSVARRRRRRAGSFRLTSSDT